MNKISIIGMGWLGQAIGKKFKNQYHVKGSSTQHEKALKLEEMGLGYHCFTLGRPFPKEEMSFFNTNILIVSLTPSSFDTKEEYGWAIKSLTDLISPSTESVLFFSSTSVFGDHQGVVSEDTTPEPSSKRGEKQLWGEKMIQEVRPDTCIIRFGGLIGPDRHPGASLSRSQRQISGNVPVNLIEREDILSFLKILLERPEKANGEIFHMVSPDHPLKKEYYSRFCQQHGLPLPNFEERDFDEKEKFKVVEANRPLAVYNFTISSPLSINFDGPQ